VNRKRAILVALLALMVVFLALLPRVADKDSTINLAVLVLLYVTLASSWNILGGYAGQTNLGHAAFFGLGALVTRQVWLSGWPFLARLLEGNSITAGLAIAVGPPWPLSVSLLAGGLVAVLFSLIIGAPAFKLRGAYFAIGTLALAQILYVTVGNERPTITALPGPYLATYDLVSRYYLFLVLALLTIGTAYFLVRSRPGLGIMAVREEEEAAESLGVGALRHKLLALGVSAFFAGLAGGAFAYYHVSYYPQETFKPIWTFDAVMMSYIGGAGTLVGPVIGALFYVVVKELLVLRLAEVQVTAFGQTLELGEVHLIIFGLLFIVVVLFLPGGLVEAWDKIRQLLTRRTQRRQLATTVQETES
jgi:branched-chain amino acid transport system permease protein